jgi:translation initiation factor 1 (eIF-1/SUI1)
MAIQHTLYISATRLKKDTALGGSVDDNLIMPYILLAQDMYILPILGTDLDAKLKSDIQGGTLTGDYRILVQDYLQKVNNAIVVMGATDQSSSASYEDIEPLMNRAKDAAEFYRQRMIDYLLDKGSAAFPEYASNNDAGELSPTTRNYYAGMNLDINAPRSNKLKSFLQGADITIYGC